MIEKDEPLSATPFLNRSMSSYPVAWLIFPPTSLSLRSSSSACSAAAKACACLRAEVSTVWRRARSCFSARARASMYLEVGVGESLGDGSAIGRGGMGSDGVDGGEGGVLAEEEDSKRRDEGRAGTSRGAAKR